MTKRGGSLAKAMFINKAADACCRGGAVRRGLPQNPFSVNPSHLNTLFQRRFLQVAGSSNP